MHSSAVTIFTFPLYCAHEVHTVCSALWGVPHYEVEQGSEIAPYEHTFSPSADHRDI